MRTRDGRRQEAPMRRTFVIGRAGGGSTAFRPLSTTGTSGGGGGPAAFPWGPWRLHAVVRSSASSSGRPAAARRASSRASASPDATDSAARSTPAARSGTLPET